MAETIDDECLNLCNALNRLPSVRTYESCCGHGNEDFRIWFYASDTRVVNFLGRLMSHNYAPYQFYNDDGAWRKSWQIIVETNDVMDYANEMAFCLVGSKDNADLFVEAESMANDVIEMWESFCRHTLKVEPFFKPDDEFKRTMREYIIV